MIVSQVNGTFCSRFHWSNTILQRRTGSLLCVANVFSVAISISSWMPSSYHLVGIFLATRFISLEIFGAWEYLPVKITNIQIKLCNLKLLQKPLVVNTFTVLPAAGVWGTVVGVWGTVVGVWGTVVGVWGTAAGVWGTAASIWGTAAGVWGTTAGVWGTTAGVWGTAAGVWGTAASIWGTAAGVWGTAAGVWGTAAGVWGTAAGVWGTAASIWGTAAGVWGTVNNWTNYTLRTECTMCELAKTRVTQLIKMAASVYTLTLCSQQLLLRISYSEGSERWDSSDNHFVTQSLNLLRQQL